MDFGEVKGAMVDGRVEFGVSFWGTSLMRALSNRSWMAGADVVVEVVEDIVEIEEDEDVEDVEVEKGGAIAGGARVVVGAVEIGA